MKGIKNQSIRSIVAVMLACAIVFCAGCAETTSRGKHDDDSHKSDRTPEPEAEDASVTALRQSMVDTPQLFAVAYFGYHDTIDSDLPVDPYQVMQENVPQMCEDLPFLLEIPEERIIGEFGDLFCIVPLDADATVAVSKGSWDDSSEQYFYEDSLYYAESGDPILLFCNNSGWEPDTQLYISGPSGEVFWNPQVDDNRCVMPLRNDNWEMLFLDFSPYREMLTANYSAMMESEWIMPTAEALIGTTWTWDGYLKDGREVSYRVTFHGDTLTVRWNDGYDETYHEYQDAQWELTYEEGFAVLIIDFREFAGILRYNLLYHEVYEVLYVGVDVLQEELPMGWEPLYRYLMQPITPEPAEMVGTWELAYTEVEGDRNSAEPGRCILEITEDENGQYWISFTDNEFPEWNYYGKELCVFYRELYSGCGNDQWLATVNYTGMGGTEYRVTVLDDGTLLMQNYWEMDGAPMVSYGWYERID